MIEPMLLLTGRNIKTKLEQSLSRRTSSHSMNMFGCFAEFRNVEDAIEVDSGSHGPEKETWG